MRLAFAALPILLLGSPVSAREEGWLSTSVIELIEANNASEFEALFTTVWLESESGDQIEPATVLSMLAGCDLEYAQDRVFHTGSDMTTGAMLGYRCGTQIREVSDASCEDAGYSLVAPALTGDHGRTLIVRARSFWAGDRCGPEQGSRLSALEGVN